MIEYTVDNRGVVPSTVTVSHSPVTEGRKSLDLRPFFVYCTKFWRHSRRISLTRIVLSTRGWRNLFREHKCRSQKNGSFGIITGAHGLSVSALGRDDEYPPTREAGDCAARPRQFGNGARIKATDPNFSPLGL